MAIRQSLSGTFEELRMRTTEGIVSLNLGIPVTIQTPANCAKKGLESRSLLGWTKRRNTIKRAKNCVFLRGLAVR